ncbi:MAG: hypothetical protein R3B09_27935 [Nannocystaceae bacterium]
MTLRTCPHPLPAIALLLGACADAGAPAAKKEAAPAAEPPAAPADADPPAPSDPPVEAPTPPAPAGPPRLSVAIEGHATLGFDLVGERAMVFRRSELHALDRNGALLESYATPTDRDLGDMEILQVGGREGGSIFMVANTGGRGDYIPVLAFYDDGAWRRPRAVSEGVAVAWPWIDASTLALAIPATEDEAYRLAVVRGAPKAPKLDGLKGCVDPSLTASDVAPDGAIGLAFACEAGLWAWSWRPGDASGESTKLGPGEGDIRSVDVRGERMAIAVDGPRPRLHERDAAGWHDEAPPGAGAIVGATFDPAGVLHLARGPALHRRDGAGWADASPPGEGPLLRIAGVDVGSPWVHRTSGLYARRDGAWEAVTLPPAAFVADHFPRIEALKVSPSGQAWLLGEFYAKQVGRTVASHYYSVLTSGAIGQPLRIGEILGHDLTRDEAPEPGMNKPSAEESVARTPIGPTPWPRTPGPECSERLVLLVPGTPVNRAGDYKGARRQLRGRSELAGARFVEVELGGLPLFGALVPDPALADALVAVGRKINKWRSPEIVCGDPAELEAAKVKVTRELKIDLATGEVVGP